MTKEQVYKEQMERMGTWDEAFAPAVHQLCILERELSRTNKEWHSSVQNGRAPSVLDKRYAIMTAQRRDILVLRESLGLTPKGLQKLRGKAVVETAVDPLADALAGLEEMTRGMTL